MHPKPGRISVGGVLVIVAATAVLALAAHAIYGILRPMVDVTSVVSGPVVEAFYATGTVSAQREYSVRSNTSGIVHVLVDKGDNVKKGQLLARVDSGELRFAVEQAKAELHRKQLLADETTSPVLGELRAKIQASDDMLAIALKDQKRVTGLLERGATSQNDLDQSINRVKTIWSDDESYKSQLKSRKIDLDKDAEVAKAALDSAQWDLDQTEIHSPIDGKVLDWPISDGTRVAVNDHVMQIADVTPANLVMRAQVDEEDKNKLRPPEGGDPQVVKMTLYSYPDVVLTGSVDKIYDKADPDRRTYEVDVKFEKPDPRLAAGMTGELNFIVAQKPSALIVPSQAVQAGSVMVVRDGQLQRVDVVTGLKSVERTEISSGLASGDVIVISPTLGLDSGQQVRVRPMDPIKAAALNEPEDDGQSFKGFR